MDKPDNLDGWPDPNFDKNRNAFPAEELWKYAGQHIACPECQQSIKVPVPNRGGLRTSGYALTSVVLALVGIVITPPA